MDNKNKKPWWYLEIGELYVVDGYFYRIPLWFFDPTLKALQRAQPSWIGLKENESVFFTPVEHIDLRTSPVYGSGFVIKTDKHNRLLFIYSQSAKEYCSVIKKLT